MALEDLTRYQYGSLAARLLQSQDGGLYVPGALEQLASDLGIKESAEGFIQGTMASEKGLETAVMTYAGKYEKAMGELTIKELYNTYKKCFEGNLSYEEKEIVDKKYSFNEAKVGEMKKKIAKLQHQAKSPDEKEREKAKKELEEYQDLVYLFTIVQDNLYKNLLPKAIERTNQMRLKELVRK
jgi:hypothetical protein